MKKVNRDEWIPSDNIILEQNAYTAAKCEQNILVVAGPGAGKTEMLAQKAGYLFQTNICKNPQKILAISFKADAAENLKQRVCRRYGEDIKTRFTSMTYDAFAKRILDRFFLALPEECQPDKDYEINNSDTINAAFEKAGYNNPNKLNKSELIKFYYKTLSEVEFPMQQNGLRENVWSLLLKGFDGRKATLNFRMICILAEYIFRSNPMLKRALQDTYSYVFLDEFQDTTTLQYRLVKTCFKDSQTKITAVGDGKQRIMLWAGALKSVFSDFKTDFLAKEIKLIMNHRSAPRLVELQRLMYESLNEKGLKVTPSNKWNPKEGEINLIISSSEIEEAKKVCKDIKEKINGGISINDICILCKQKPKEYSTVIIDELEKMGVRARIETEYQDIIKEPISDYIIRFIRLALDRKRPDDWEDIRSISENIKGIEYTQENSAYYYFENEFIKTLNIIRKYIKCNNKVTVKIIIDQIINFCGQKDIIAYYPVYQQDSYYNEIINKLNSMLENELKHHGYNWLLALDGFCGKDSIPIMTIHKSKGLEYEAVYFVGLEDSAFWNFKKQPAEDRCAFFVAISRAKKYLTFTYCSNRESFKNPVQLCNDINEFYDLLTGLAKII